MDYEEKEVQDNYIPPHTTKGIKIEHLKRYKEDKNGCWIWQGVDRGLGYGVIHLKTGKGGSIFAHRYFYEKMIGKIPKGKIICHTCDVPACVNISHLFIGTQKDNMSDRIKKGKNMRGENHILHKLNWEQVKKIREECTNKQYGIYKKLAKKYKVHQTIISRVNRNLIWKI